MVKRGTALPKKLKQDAILEALVELRFDSKTITELFLGRVLEQAHWKTFVPQHLPAYEIPPQLRSITPNMRFVPIMQLSGEENKAALRIGSAVISYHRLAPYTGWEKFKSELSTVVETLFKSADNLNITRIGLRYMNALRPSIHFVNSLADLDLKIVVAEGEITKAANLNFTTKVGDQMSSTVRVATKEFIQGVIPEDTSIYVDVDVFTDDGFHTSDQKAVNEWIELAHTKEKDEFFHLFRLDTISDMREA